MPESKSFSKKQLFIAAGILFIAAIFMMMMGGNHEPPKQVQKVAPAVTVSPGTSSASNQSALVMAKELAGFPGKVPDGWEIKDTTAQTEGKPSFTLSSQRQDQKLLFVIWDNSSPVDQIDLITVKVPFTDYDIVHSLKDIQVDRGQTYISGQPFNWYVGKYTHKDKTQMCFVGAFRSPAPEKAVVVIGQPYSDNDRLDYKTSLWLIDTMAGPTSTDQSNTNATESTQAIATPQEITAYQDKIKSLINKSLKTSKGIGEKKSTAVFEVDNDGKVTKIIMSEPSGDDNLDQYLVNTINSCQPFPIPPHTKHNTLLLHATISSAGLDIF